MTIFDAHGVLTFRARHRIRESLKGGGGILYYLYLSSKLQKRLRREQYRVVLRDVASRTFVQMDPFRHMWLDLLVLQEV